MNETKIINIAFALAVAAEAFLVFMLKELRGSFDPVLEWSTHISVNASFNFLSAMALAISIYFVKNKKIKQHSLFIHLALTFSALFLVSYILFHLTHNHPIKEYIIPKILFYLLLGTHIFASVVSLPMIFISYGLGLFNKISEHKRFAKMTFYLWEYVSITGIIVVLVSLFSKT